MQCFLFWQFYYIVLWSNLWLLQYRVKTHCGKLWWTRRTSSRKIIHFYHALFGKLCWYMFSLTIFGNGREWFNRENKGMAWFKAMVWIIRYPLFDWLRKWKKSQERIQLNSWLILFCMFSLCYLIDMVTYRSSKMLCWVIRHLFLTTLPIYVFNSTSISHICIYKFHPLISEDAMRLCEYHCYIVLVIL